MTPAVRIAVAAGILCTGACRHAGAPAPPRTASASARSYQYVDDSGLYVGTYGAEASLPVGRRGTVDVHAVSDRVVVDSRKILDPAKQTQGSVAPDVVTSASSTVGGGSVARKWRHEGVLAAAFDGHVGQRPAGGGVILRTSREPDYLSFSGALRGSVELGDRNTTLTAQAGYGHDSVRPVAAPPGQTDKRPASHQRVSGVLSGGQILSPTLIFSGSLAATVQRGQLSSPYRRAIVNTTLYPEAVPDARNRYTAFAGLSWHAADGLALHLRQGAYADSWQVRAVIPEAMLAVELDPEGVLATAHYRFYRQWPASFYRARYDAILPAMSGDLRLGSLREHAVGGDLRWTLAAREPRTLAVLAGYEVSVLDYTLAGTRVVAHVFSLGLGGAL